MKFIYKALKPGGEEIKGEIETNDEQDAKSKIREFGIFPTALLPYSPSSAQQNDGKEREPTVKLSS